MSCVGLSIRCHRQPFVSREGTLRGTYALAGVDNARNASCRRSTGATARTSAQGWRRPEPPADSGRIACWRRPRRALSPKSNSLITRMLQAGELTSVRVQDDPQIAGRQIQTLQQVYRGFRSKGAASRCRGRVRRRSRCSGRYSTPSRSTSTPAIAPVDAARIIEKAANAFIAFGASPTLVVVPSPAGTFRADIQGDRGVRDHLLRRRVHRRRRARGR